MALLAGVVAVGTGRWRAAPSSDAGRASIRSPAVLPLANLSGDPEQEYFVAGMQNALIGEPGQIGALAVISRTSTMRYRNTEKTVPEIAQELGVDALVEGSMFREGENVRIQVQLIGAAPVERDLWSGTYDGDLRNVLALQKRVSRAIADQIQVELTPHEAARLATARTVNPAAYDAWTKGWFEFSRITADSLRRCLVHADAALAIDPNYAPGYALSPSCLGLCPPLHRCILRMHSRRPRRPRAEPGIG